MWEGLEALGPCAWVVVHDGARPLVTPQLIEEGLAAARETGAAVCGLPAGDTVKRVDEQGQVMRTLDRRRLWLVQTPQVFRYDILREAHERSRRTATDDAALVERLGHRVRVYPGSSRNLKVTTPEDLALAEALLKSARPRIELGGGSSCDHRLGSHAERKLKSYLKASLSLAPSRLGEICGH